MLPGASSEEAKRPERRPSWVGQETLPPGSGQQPRLAGELVASWLPTAWGGDQGLLPGTRLGNRCPVQGEVDGILQGWRACRAAGSRPRLSTASPGGDSAYACLRMLKARPLGSAGRAAAAWARLSPGPGLSCPLGLGEPAPGSGPTPPASSSCRCGVRCARPHLHCEC